MPPATQTLPSNTPSPFVWVRNKFLTGLAVALPLLITFWILQSAYHLLHGWSVPILNFVAQLVNELAGRVVLDPESETFGLYAQFLGVVIPILFFVGLGVMATNVIGVRVVGAIDTLLLNVPIVSFIYKSLKQVIDGFKGLGGRQNFKRVVYVDYPSGEMKLLGFVTGQFLDPQQDKVVAAVFVPGALSPMTGLLLVVPLEQLTDAPLSVEDAMKLIFSGGLVVPSKLSGAVLQPDLAVAPLPAEADQVDEEELAPEPDLPAGLPRAEDFDSGDPDILSDSEAEGAQLAGNRSPGRRLLGALAWKRRGD